MENTIFTALAGVSFSNTNGNCENRQHLIHELYKSGQLTPNSKLSIVIEPENIYDKNAIAVYAPDGRQLGYLPKGQAKQLHHEVQKGNCECEVVSVTGGEKNYSYGINVKIVIRQPLDIEPSITSYADKKKIYIGSTIVPELPTSAGSLKIQSENMGAKPKFSDLLATGINQPECDDYEYLQDLFTSKPIIDYVEYDGDGEFVVYCPEPTGNEYDDFGFSIYASMEDYFVDMGYEFASLDDDDDDCVDDLQDMDFDLFEV